MTAPTTRETADHAELARLADEMVGLLAPSQGERLLEYERHQLDVASRIQSLSRALLSEIAALRGEVGDLKRHRDRLAITCQRRLDDWRSAQAQATQAERRRDELRKALERAADDLRDIGGQSPRPSNSPDPEHENYLRRVLISLAQVGNTRARQVLANQGADKL